MSGMPSPSPSRINGGDRDKDSMWYFSSDDLATSPSRKAGISPDQELSYRQMTAYLIQEMGQRLQVSQLCINTAIVYMHRFYAFHSFTHFHRNGIAAASLFLAAKVEEQPRKLEHVIKAANKCLNQPTTSTTDTYYLEQAQDLVFNENVLLQTLGFDVAIDHPHTHVVKTCHLVKACKDLAQTSYFLASNSLHLTSMCLQYKPTVVACFCIYLACKWSRWEIPQSTEGKHWFHYVDETVTMDLLKKLTDEFIAIYEKSPARLKSKLNSIKALAQGASNRQGQVKDKKADQDWKVSDMMNMKMYHPAEIAPTSSSNNNGSQNDLQQQSGGITQPMLPPPPHPQTQQMRKTELHTSSQHRSHHSSSSSSATSSSSSTHHPPKLGYTPGDVPDHKLSKQQQQQQQPPYGSSSTLVSNRPPREHTTSTSQHPTAMLAPSSNPSTKSSSRSSMSNSLTGQPSLRHSSTQGHAMDVNYKSRDRGLTAPPPPTAAHSLPPHGMQHKLSQKQDGGSRSMSSKDHTGRLPAEQQSKLSSSNSNKVFSTSSSSQYGSNSNNQTQLTTGSTSGSNQASVKLENLHDMSRNMMHNTRGGYNNPPPPLPTQATTSATAPLLNFHQQQQQGSRHSNNNSSSSSSSLKLEQSKQQQISVHMQQQTQTSAHQHHQHHQKQPLITATDPTTYTGLTGATHDLQQPPPHASLISNNYSKIEPLQHSEDPHHPNVTTQYNSQAQNQVAKAANSVFSPDWSDKLHAEQMQQPPPQLTSATGGGYNNNGTNMTQNSDIYAANFNIKKESPPKIKTERDTPSKKDKNRSSSNSQQDNGRSSGHNTQNMLKTTITKKLDTSLTNTSSLLGLNELAGTSSVGVAGGSSNIVGGVKRPNEQPTIKTEDDLLIRDSKIRKLDGTTDIGKHQVVNGIETNPDLVRNLLKESLLPITSLLKTETSIITPSLEPPAELFEPSATTSSSSSSLAQPHNTSITLSSSLSNTNNNNVLSGNSDISAMETDDHANTVSKSEKKKKKDKHKHKEKDKSKDREERKKHKKDKDRHKDKERDNADNNTSEHVKIKISKEKLESAGEPIGFKIKIPKERLMGDLSGANTSHAHHNDSQAPPVLKIKISKDKLESYSSGSADMVTNMTASTHSAYAGHTQSTGGYAGSTTHTSSGSSSSSSNKKKDRDREKDRERDKDKKRSHDSSSSSVSKSSNGGAGGGSNMTVSAAINNTTATNGSIAGSHSTYSGNGAATTQKTQNSSKIHHQSNMSLLFGESNESNDDDDDDYNDDY